MKKHSLTTFLPVTILVTCLAVILSMAACSSKNSSSPDTTAANDGTKYAVQIYVDCEKNLFFSRYDVDMSVDGEKVGNIEHGSEATFEVSLAKGQHELRFVEEGHTSPDGNTSFVVEKEGDKFSYKISCTQDQIEIMSIKEEPQEKERSETANADSQTSATKEDESKESKPEENAETAKRSQFAQDAAACKDQSVAHAYQFIKDSGHEYKFKLSETYRGTDVTKDVQDERYEGARERTMVAGASVSDDDSLVTFTVDRPLTITTEDNEDLAALLNAGNISMADPMLSDFASKYSGVSIEFDGYTSAHFQHGDYKTRFDYFIVAGDSTDSGMPFFFEDVNFSDFNWIGHSPSSIDSNLRCHFIAEVEKYDMALGSAPTIYLKPVATTLL